MLFLDAFLGDYRWYRRLRGGYWMRVFHAPSTCTCWFRRTERRGSEVQIDGEDYRHPRARLLP
jgi:hypothetical protein